MTEKQRMKICHIAPLVDAIGPQAPGGAEHMLRVLAEAQSINGHEVSVIATEGSTFPERIRHHSLGIRKGDLSPIRTELGAEEQSVRADKAKILTKERNVFAKVRAFLEGEGKHFDVVHNHAFDEAALVGLNSLEMPLVHTLHLLPIIPWINESLKSYREKPSAKVRYVSVSRASQFAYRELFGFTPSLIYCGLELKRHPFHERSADYFITVARVSKEKGIAKAIHAVAEVSAQKLLLVGQAYDQAYLASLSPALKHPLVDYRGSLPNSEVLELLSHARALVLPVEKGESFGLVYLEALAAGAPVITSPLGAATEIVRHGENGFLVKNEAELLSALENVHTIDRRACRASVLEQFSLAQMMRAYESEYEKAIQASTIQE